MAWIDMLSTDRQRLVDPTAAPVSGRRGFAIEVGRAIRRGGCLDGATQDLSRAMSRIQPLHEMFDAETLNFATDAFHAARPRPKDDERTIVRYACELVTWALSRGVPLDPAVVFDPSTVDEYLATEFDGEKGSAVARRSYLTRLHPERGLDSGRRRSAPASTSLPSSSTCADMTVKASTDAIDAVRAYRPSFIPEHVWPRLQPTVVSAVEATPVERAGRALDLARSASMLTGWVHADGRPLRPELVFDAGSVERFAETFRKTAHQPSLATHVSNLRCIQSGLTLPPARHLHGATGDVLSAYDDADLDRLLQAAARVQTAKRRRYLTAVIVLPLAFGYHPREIVWAEPKHLVDADGGLLAEIHAPARYDQHLTADANMVAEIFGVPTSKASSSELTVRDRVLALPRWEGLARQVRDDAVRARDRFLIGGDGADRRARVNTVIGDAGLDVHFHVAQVRQRWLADFLGPHLEPLRDAIGTSTLHLDRMFGRAK